MSSIIDPRSRRILITLEMMQQFDLLPGEEEATIQKALDAWGEGTVFKFRTVDVTPHVEREISTFIMDPMAAPEPPKGPGTVN